MVETSTEEEKMAAVFGFNNSRHLPLEVKVLYLRVSYGPMDGNPDFLTVRFPPRSIDKYLEVNGARIPPSEGVCLSLRRDRMDTGSIEVTYVSTDHVHAVGYVNLEILDKEELLITARLQEINNSWNMDCSCSVPSSGCVFTRGNKDYSPPSMEICLVGCCSKSPVILTSTVPLMARRRSPRCGTLDAIPEDEECGRLEDKTPLAVSRGEDAVSVNASESSGGGKFFLPEYGDNDDGDMSWFNAGVRVGVGIGLGMCLGVGIGVGLMVRTYQATTRSFRRRLW